MTPARYWLLQMLLEWALTCKYQHTHCIIIKLFSSFSFKNSLKRMLKGHFMTSVKPPPLSRSIKRIIFNSLVKPNVNEKGEKQMETISTSQALQIAGRAGRSVSFLLILTPFRRLKGGRKDAILTSHFSLWLLSPLPGSLPSLKREKWPPCTEMICLFWRKYSATP